MTEKGTLRVIWVALNRFIQSLLRSEARRVAKKAECSPLCKANLEQRFRDLEMGHQVLSRRSKVSLQTSLSYPPKGLLRRPLEQLLKLWEILGTSPLERDQNPRQVKVKICSLRGWNLLRFSRTLQRSKHLNRPILKYQAKQNLAASEVTKLPNLKIWWCNLKIPKLWQINWNRLDTLIKFLIIILEPQIAVLEEASETLRTLLKI